MTPHDFFVIFGAVFGAILMSGCFFWGLITYSRMEKHGTENTAKGNTVWVAMMFPLIFGALAIINGLGAQ